MTVHINSKAATISATTSSARTALTVADQGREGLYIYNSGTVPVLVRSGDSSVAAAAGDNVIPAGGSRLLMKNTTDTHLAAITASGSATVYFHGASVGDNDGK